MIDPFTAIAVATKAFNTVKRMVSAGHEIESTLSQIGIWYGAVADFNEAKREAHNPPLFKRLVSKKSVEQEAMDIYVQQKKVNKQENELRTLLLYTYGTGGYQELVDLRRKIREQREATVYAQARRRRSFMWNSIACLALSAMAYGIYLIITVIARQANG